MSQLAYVACRYRRCLPLPQPAPHQADQEQDGDDQKPKGQKPPWPPGAPRRVDRLPLALAAARHAGIFRIAHCCPLAPGGAVGSTRKAECAPSSFCRPAIPARRPEAGMFPRNSCSPSISGSRKGGWRGGALMACQHGSCQHGSCQQERGDGPAPCRGGQRLGGLEDHQPEYRQERGQRRETQHEPGAEIPLELWR